MKNLPQRIFLQVGDVDKDTDFSELSDITWCVDRINDSDIEYRLVKKK